MKEFQIIKKIIMPVIISEKDEFNVIYVAPFEHLKGSIISQIIKDDDYKEICLKALQLFDPEIIDMVLFKSDTGNRPVEFLKHKRLGNMPLSTFGDGMNDSGETSVRNLTSALKYSIAESLEYCFVPTFPFILSANSF